MVIEKPPRLILRMSMSWINLKKPVNSPQKTPKNMSWIW